MYKYMAKLSGETRSVLVIRSLGRMGGGGRRGEMKED